MTVTLYEITIPVFIKYMQTLSKLLEKGIAYTKEDGAKITEAQLVESKLIDGMGDLVYQIQRISDIAKGVAQRIGGVEPVVLEDNEKTFPELFTRIQKTIEVLQQVKPEYINAQEEAEVLFKRKIGDLKMTGRSSVIDFAIPNFYFHYTTAYALLRKEGVEVGKADYLGRN